MTTYGDLPNYINGDWHASSAKEYLEIVNPATAEVLGKTPLSPADEVDQAAQAAAAAFDEWRRTPPTDRVVRSLPSTVSRRSCRRLNRFRNRIDGCESWNTLRHRCEHASPFDTLIVRTGITVVARRLDGALVAHPEFLVTQVIRRAR